jgi:hypothetical protein
VTKIPSIIIIYGIIIITKFRKLIWTRWNPSWKYLDPKGLIPLVLVNISALFTCQATILHTLRWRNSLLGAMTTLLVSITIRNFPTTRRLRLTDLSQQKTWGPWTGWGQCCYHTRFLVPETESTSNKISKDSYEFIPSAWIIVLRVSYTSVI